MTNKPKTNKWEKFLDKKVMSFGGIGFNFWVKVKEKDVLELITQTQQETLEEVTREFAKLPIYGFGDKDIHGETAYIAFSDFRKLRQTIKQRIKSLKIKGVNK